jgi:hypothetical protein
MRDTRDNISSVDYKEKSKRMKLSSASQMVKTCGTKLWISASGHQEAEENGRIPMEANFEELRIK